VAGRAGENVGSRTASEATVYLDLIDWRRSVAQLYAEVRAEADPRSAHELWRAGRDRLFLHHRQSPLGQSDPLRYSGLPYWPYDPSLRFTAPLTAAEAPHSMTVPSSDGEIRMRLVGQVRLPDPIDTAVDVWWLEQYAGGMFIPLRDGTAGAGSYGGGRYLLDTAKGADLGAVGSELVLDLNFLYHPSCRYSPEWSCPLAPSGNRISAAVRAGERMSNLP
jgi:uncharacterized protein (DUF1684 family)